jgi:site-specific recombinase XerD
MFKISIQFSCDLLKSFQPKTHKNTMTKLTFTDVATQLISQLETGKSKSTVDNYRTALRSFCHFAGTGVLIEQIDVPLMEHYQQWLHEQHVTPNTVSCYMRSLRSLLYRLKPSLKQQSLFDTVYTGKAHTDKRSIPFADIVRIRGLSLSPASPLAFSRDLFLFSFYALGMPFVDIAFLLKSQIHNDHIIYYRHKTGQRICIKLESPIEQIIHRYIRKDSPYVFPILSAGTHADVFKDYENARSRYNRHLRKIGEMAGLAHRLTSYVARHSWASMAYHANIDLSVISKALGHTSPNTTLTYIREIDDERIDQANHLLLNQIT